MPRLGRTLASALRTKGGLDRGSAMTVCADAVMLLATLQQAGWLLPDAHPARFELSLGGHLWLTDVRGLRRDAGASPAALALALCRDVVASARRYLAPDDVRTALAGQPTLDELLAVFSRYRLIESFD